MDYEEANKVLDVVERVFRSFLYRHELKRPEIDQRWRWDEPGITLIWIHEIGGDYVGKNMHVLLVDEDAEVEVNAWLDEDIGAGGKTRIRHWWHKQIETLPIPFDESELRKSIERGYAIVSEWSRSDLKNESTLAYAEPNKSG